MPKPSLSTVRIPVPVGEMPPVPWEYTQREKAAYCRGWNDAMRDRDKTRCPYRSRMLADAYEGGHDDCAAWWQQHRVRACDRPEQDDRRVA